jgi:hypothetical protein
VTDMGGPNATLEASESVSAMRRVIATLGPSSPASSSITRVANIPGSMEATDRATLRQLGKSGYGQKLHSLL